MRFRLVNSRGCFITDDPLVIAHLAENSHNNEESIEMSPSEFLSLCGEPNRFSAQPLEAPLVDGRDVNGAANFIASVSR